MARSNSVRPSRDPRRSVALLVAAWILCAGPAAAQVVGIAPLQRLQNFDWNIEPLNLPTATERDVRQAYRHGIADLKNGNCRQAASKFEFILGFIDDDPTIYYVAATAARCLRGFRAAAGYYESAIEFEPTLYDAHHFLGISRLALGDVEAATDVLGDLELMRLECETDCEPDLEEAYASLRGALQIARPGAQQEERAP